MENFDLFELLGEVETKVVEKKVEKKSKPQTVVAPKSTSNATIVNNTVDNTENSEEDAETTVTETKTTKPAAKKKTLSKDEQIVEDCKKCTSIIVKSFGNEVFTIDDTEEIEKINLNNIKKALVRDYQYQEYNAGVNWIFALGTDKTTGYLVATLNNFKNKG